MHYIQVAAANKGAAKQCRIGITKLEQKLITDCGQVDLNYHVKHLVAKKTRINMKMWTVLKMLFVASCIMN